MLNDKDVFMNIKEDVQLFPNDQLPSPRMLWTSCLLFVTRKGTTSRAEFASLAQVNSRRSTCPEKEISKYDNPFSLSLFPIASGSFTKKLNDRITEEEFSTDILPSIDQMIHWIWFIDRKSGLIDLEKLNDRKSALEIQNVARRMNLNRWYFYGEVFYERISEGLIDQKKELQFSGNVFKRYSIRWL
jgi:hypothetical protein